MRRSRQRQPDTIDPACGNNLPAGLRCDFDCSVGAADLRLPNVGFHCCSKTAP